MHRAVDDLHFPVDATTHIVRPVGIKPVGVVSLGCPVRRIYRNLDPIAVHARSLDPDDDDDAGPFELVRLW